MLKPIKPTDGSATECTPINSSSEQSNQYYTKSPFGVSRRSFLGSLGGAAIATGLVSLSPLVIGCSDTAGSQPFDLGPLGPQTPNQRRDTAYDIRVNAAIAERNLPLPENRNNGDDERYENKIASFSKTLPHNGLGEVDLDAYEALLDALSTGDPNDFANIPSGGSRQLVNPQAALAFQLAGADSHHLFAPPAPEFDGAQAASEIAEVYWQALARDIPFDEYGSNPLTITAAEDLSDFSDFRGPKTGGVVSPDTLFRGSTPGDRAGPYISQFLWQPIPYGAITVEQRIQTAIPGDDYMVTYGDWLSVQNGFAPPLNPTAPTPTYIRNGRDMGEFVHVDFSFQAYLGACLILLEMGPLDSGNPYLNSVNQEGFVTFGDTHILHLVSSLSNMALKAAWFQKWAVHRRLRPEVFGGEIHNLLAGNADYPIHEEILNSPVLDEVSGLYDTYLLPMAYPEGSPAHPAYPAGHATMAGACVTALKAFFDESFIIPEPVIPSPDGLSLLPYVGPDLTVGGELNKLASNISLGRDFAGVHWRTDGEEGMMLGEAVALSYLRDLKPIYNEDFDGFTLTKFDGTVVNV